MQDVTHSQGSHSRPTPTIEVNVDAADRAQPIGLEWLTYPLFEESKCE